MKFVKNLPHSVCHPAPKRNKTAREQENVHRKGYHLHFRCEEISLRCDFQKCCKDFHLMQTQNPTTKQIATFTIQTKRRAERERESPTKILLAFFATNFVNTRGEYQRDNKIHFSRKEGIRFEWWWCSCFYSMLSSLESHKRQTEYRCSAKFNFGTFDLAEMNSTAQNGNGPQQQLLTTEKKKKKTTTERHFNK